MPDLPQITPDELARRLDRGDQVQVLDIRAPEKVARGRVAFGAALDFKALPGSRLYQLPTFDSIGLAPGSPVAVICGHGNSSKQMTTFLRDKGVEAYSVVGGMAAWETVYVARSLTPTPSFERVLQLDRVGKGALSYVLVSDGEALVVDPGRHVDVVIKEGLTCPGDRELLSLVLRNLLIGSRSGRGGDDVQPGHERLELRA